MFIWVMRYANFKNEYKKVYKINVKKIDAFFSVSYLLILIGILNALLKLL